MHYILIHLLAMLAVLISASVCSAESVPLDRVLATAISQSSMARDIDAQLADRIAEALRLQMLPNPEIDSEIRKFKSYSGNEPDNEIEVSFEQPFRLSHLGLRQSISELINKAGSIDQKLALLGFSQTIKLSYAKAWALQAQSATLADAKKRAAAIANVILESSKKGLLPISEARLFEAQEKKISAEIIGLEADLSRAKGELTRLSSFDLSGSVLIKPESLRSIDIDHLITSAETGSIPVQKRINLIRDIATEQRKLAERDSFPLLAPRFVYQHGGDGDDQIGIGLRFELPLFDRNQGERIRRISEEAAAITDQRYYSGELFRSELRLRIEGLRASQRQALAYEKEVLPALIQALKGAEKQLSAGQGSAIQVFQTQREVIDAASRSLELWIKAISEQSELTVLTGEEF